MHEASYRELETLFLALGDKTRLKLLTLMADGPVSVGFLADRLKESQPKVSRHLAYLRNAGLVNARRNGKWIYYGIAYPDDNAIRHILDTIVRSITVMEVDGKDVYFTTRETLSEVRKPNIYVKADVTEPASTYQYDTVDEYEESPIPKDEIDIFLL